MSWYVNERILWWYCQGLIYHLWPQLKTSVKVGSARLKSFVKRINQRVRIIARRLSSVTWNNWENWERKSELIVLWRKESNFIINRHLQCVLCSQMISRIHEFSTLDTSINRNTTGFTWRNRKRERLYRGIL